MLAELLADGADVDVDVPVHDHGVLSDHAGEQAVAAEQYEEAAVIRDLYREPERVTQIW